MKDQIPPFATFRVTQIVTGVKPGSTHVLYALDEAGQVWVYQPLKDGWEPMQMKSL